MNLATTMWLCFLFYLLCNAGTALPLRLEVLAGGGGGGADSDEAAFWTPRTLASVTNEMPPACMQTAAGER
jgi:hypothetical protein